MMTHPKRSQVCVITDAAPPRSAATSRALAYLLATAFVAIPVIAATALLVGLVLGWQAPLLIICVTVAALPVLINLVDLLAARAGLPPLAWIASQINPLKESRDG